MFSFMLTVYSTSHHYAMEKIEKRSLFYWVDKQLTRTGLIPLQGYLEAGW